MMSTKQRNRMFERLKQGLAESIAHVRGELNLRTVGIPDEPPYVDAQTLAALRRRANMSQAVFARMLNVSTKALQSWEQGTRRPSEAARRLIQVFSEQPEILCQIVGLPAVHLAGVAIERDQRGSARIVVNGHKPRKAI